MDKGKGKANEREVHEWMKSRKKGKGKDSVNIMTRIKAKEGKGKDELNKLKGT